MKMHALMSAHVVRLSGIGKEVGLSACLDAFGYKREALLRHHGGVVVSRDDLKFAFQVFRFLQQAALGIAFWIGLRRIHVALSIHDFIPFPVDDRAASHSHLEHIRVIGHQSDGHETAKTPSMYAHALLVYIGQTLQEFHAFHLVLHFHLA